MDDSSSVQFFDSSSVQFLDRTVGARGRRGFVSLMALNAAFIGDDPNDWPVIAVRAAIPLQPGAPARSTELPHLNWAADAACNYGAQVAHDPRLQSADLPALALRNREDVARFAQAFR